MVSKFKKGKIYRNSHQIDVDFYVTNIRLYSLVGYWLTRKSMLIMHKDPDIIPFDRIDMNDWTELDD